MSTVDLDSVDLEIKEILADPLKAPTDGVPAVDGDDPFQDINAIDLQFCDVKISSDLWKPPPFTESQALKNANERAFRFGGSSDMMTLLEGTSSDKQSYLIGLVATSIVITTFYLLWCIVILVLKFTGYRRCGFLCGRFIRPKAPDKGESVKNMDDEEQGQDTDSIAGSHTDKELKAKDEREEPEAQDGSQDETPQALEGDVDEPEETAPVDTSQTKSLEGDGFPVDASDEYKDWYRKCERQKVRLFRTRVVVVLCCLMISISGILFCNYGYKYLTQSVTTIQDGLRHIQKLVVSAISLIDNLDVRQDFATNYTKSSLDSINGICPNVRTKLCSVVDEAAGTVSDCSFEGIPIIGPTLQLIVEELYGAKQFIIEKLDKAREDLVKLNNDLDNYSNGSVDMEWAFWVSFAFAICLMICCIVIIYGIWLAHRGKMNRYQDCIRHRCMLPFFGTMVFLALLFAIVFTMASTGASDFCINSPDPKINYLMDQLDENKKDMVFQFAKYYVNQCDPYAEPVNLQDDTDALVETMQQIQSFANDVSSINTTEWTETCGSDATVIKNFANITETAMCLVALTLQDVERFFWCRQFAPVYQLFVHDAICYNVTEGLIWVASTMIVIVFCSFVVLCLRAGAFDIEDEETYLYNVRKCRVCAYAAVTCACCRGHKGQDEVDLNEEEDEYYEPEGQDEGGDNDVSPHANDEPGTPDMPNSPGEEQRFM